MQDELSKLRREMLRRQTYSFRDSRSPISVSDTATQNSLQQSAYRARQNEHERVVSEMQHLQQEVARLRQERDAARMQRGDRPASPAKQALHKRPGGQGWLQSLEIENERLQGELDALRQRAATTPQHELRTKNERLVSQLRELERGDKTRAQLGYEVAALKQELDQMRRTSGKNSTAALRRQVKEFTLNTQMDLERQMAAMQSRALVAEEQLQSLQHYLAQSTVAYQKEIMRLRNMLSDVSQATGVAADGDNVADVDARLALHRSGSAGDALQRPLSARAQRPELRPIRSATNRQGRLPRPLNQRPAVDAWHMNMVTSG
ncbi:MAG: coiled-coil domain-containing 78 [Trebouxia sp. A1-2]|nr:MAG: coiled-coil domain-containing 78 [Trebouxia sp. A1-2]